MGRIEINEKLKSFLTKQPFTEECRVVYLMMEFRKILDHAYDRNKDFTLLRFYCDWLVHTEKSKISDSIKIIIEKLYEEIKFQIETGSPGLKGDTLIVGFIYMEDLKKEILEFLSKENLPLDLCTNEDFWVNFIKNIVGVLVDQPILKPTRDVSAIVLLPATPGCISGHIYFTIPIVGKDAINYDHYTFRNAY